MGLLERIKNVVQANINDLIDSSRDPESMLERFIEQSEEDLEKAKSEMATAVREERRLKQRIEEERQRVAHWEEKALQAVQKGEDEQARDIIRRKRRAVRSLRLAEQQWAEQENLVELLRLHIEELQEKLQEMKLRRTQLTARHRVLEMRRRYRERLQVYAEEFGLEEAWPPGERFEPAKAPERRAEAELPPSRRPELEPDLEIDMHYRLQEIEREKAPSLEDEIEKELRQLKAQYREDELPPETPPPETPEA
jgi:phage shock protein A